MSSTSRGAREPESPRAETPRSPPVRSPPVRSARAAPAPSRAALRPRAPPRAALSTRNGPRAEPRGSRRALSRPGRRAVRRVVRVVPDRPAGMGPAAPARAAPGRGARGERQAARLHAERLALTLQLHKDRGDLLLALRDARAESRQRQRRPPRGPRRRAPILRLRDGRRDLVELAPKQGDGRRDPLVHGRHRGRGRAGPGWRRRRGPGPASPRSCTAPSPPPASGRRAPDRRRRRSPAVRPAPRAPTRATRAAFLLRDASVEMRTAPGSCAVVAPLFCAARSAWVSSSVVRCSSSDNFVRVASSPRPGSQAHGSFPGSAGAALLSPRGQTVRKSTRLPLSAGGAVGGRTQPLSFFSCGNRTVVWQERFLRKAVTRLGCLLGSYGMTTGYF